VGLTSRSDAAYDYIWPGHHADTGHIKYWTESIAVSESFTGASRFDINFAYDHLPSLGSKYHIAGGWLDIRTEGIVAFGLLDLIDKEQVAYGEQTT
jgi:hypothetical protein